MRLRGCELTDGAPYPQRQLRNNGALHLSKVAEELWAWVFAEDPDRVVVLYPSARLPPFPVYAVRSRPSDQRLSRKLKKSGRRKLKLDGILFYHFLCDPAVCVFRVSFKTSERPRRGAFL